MSHPEEQLAAYVDGTLEQSERADVEAHLASCATCREEVELAGRARASLASLPELDMPRDWVQPKATGAGARLQDRFRRVRWTAGIAGAAAAAAIVVGLVVANLGSSGGSAPGLSLGRASASVAPDRGILRRPRTNYDPAAIRTLAGRLSSRYARRPQELSAAGSAGGTTATSGSVGSPSPGGRFAQNAPSSDAVSGSPVDCLRLGAGVPPSDRALTAIEARYQGTPAYIGAFLRGGTRPTSVVVWVVARRGCSVLGGARHRIR